MNYYIYIYIYIVYNIDQNVRNQITIDDIKGFIFVGFSYKTFIFAIIVIQIIGFIVELSVDLSGLHVITPIGNDTLEALGGLSWPLIKKYHFHRFILAPFYNYTLFGLIGSILLHAFSGFRLEYEMKKIQFIFLYMISGILAMCCTGIYNYKDVIVGSYYHGNQN